MPNENPPRPAAPALKRDPRLNAEQVREILKNAMPPDGGPGSVLGGLMLDFIERLCDAEGKLEKAGKFLAFTKEKVGQHEERISAIEGAVSEASSATGTTPPPNGGPTPPAAGDEGGPEHEGMVEPGAYGMPVGTVETPPPNGAK